MQKEFIAIRSTYSIYPTSLLTIHSTHDCGGSEQVDPLITLYKRNKSYSPKVCITIHHFPLCTREKIDLTVKGSLAGLHQSPLIVLFFFSGPKSHHHSPKHYSLLISVYYQRPSTILPEQINTLSFFITTLSFKITQYPCLPKKVVEIKFLRTLGTYKQSSNIKTLELKHKLNTPLATIWILLPLAKVRNSSPSFSLLVS